METLRPRNYFRFCPFITVEFDIESGQSVAVHVDGTIGHPKLKFLFEQMDATPKEIQVPGSLKIILHHGDEHWRLGSLLVVDAPAVGHQAVLVHHLEEIVQHAFYLRIKRQIIGVGRAGDRSIVACGKTVSFMWEMRSPCTIQYESQ